MFGGYAFMIGGNMAVAASGSGGIMFRADPDAAVELVESTPAYPMVMRGRQLRGWLRVDAADLTGEGLAAWVEWGRAYAASLPVKAPR